MIQTTQELESFLNSCNGDFHALDTEADSLHSYHEKLCLIQYSDGEQHRLIDPLVIEDVSPLTNLVQSSELWMHGADYDMTLMRKHWGILPDVVWDTQIAARLLGVTQFGYAHLVEHFLGVSLEKASQKADWSMRPLTAEMEEYAVDDVRYLKPMADLLIGELNEKSRYSWFVESCERAQQKVLERPQSKPDPWRIQGAGKLPAKGLLYLRALWYWRDAEASAWDRPSFMVCGNKQLISWAFDALNQKTIHLPKYFRSSRKSAFFEALERANDIAESMWPKRLQPVKRRVKDEAFMAVCESLAKKRDAAANRLGIEGSLLISRTEMETIAAKELAPAELLMQWQCEVLEIESLKL